MGIANWTMLTGMAASAIMAAWLFYKYKLADARLSGALQELDEVKRRRAELAAQVLHQKAEIEKLQREAVKQYEAYAKSIESSVKPGTPGSTGATIGFMIEEINGKNKPK